eukprot:scaffold97816_cov59-Attheya_sp.AAC.5
MLPQIPAHSVRTTNCIAFLRTNIIYLDDTQIPDGDNEKREACLPPTVNGLILSALVCRLGKLWNIIIHRDPRERFVWGA